MSNAVRWDDEMPVYYHNDDDMCSGKVGLLRYYTKLVRNDYQDYSGAGRTEWGMKQKGFMYPLAANKEEFRFLDEFGSQYECWTNSWGELVQDWGTGDLQDLVEHDYYPSFTDETTTSINTSYSVSYPESIGMSVSVSFPKLKIQSEWDPMNYKLRATHEFQDRGKGLDDDFDLDAADENVILGTVTGFNSTKPDSGDKIVKGSMYGTFGGHGLICGVNDLFECPGKLPDYEVKERNATAHAFYEYEIDDL